VERKLNAVGGAERATEESLSLLIGRRNSIVQPSVQDKGLEPLDTRLRSMSVNGNIFKFNP